jgi:hypothetical protein
MRLALLAYCRLEVQRKSCRTIHQYYEEDSNENNDRQMLHLGPQVFHFRHIRGWCVGAKHQLCYIHHRCTDIEGNEPVNLSPCNPDSGAAFSSPSTGVLPTADNEVVASAEAAATKVEYCAGETINETAGVDVLAA